MTYVPRTTFYGVSTSWASVATRPTNPNHAQIGYNEATGQVECYDAVNTAWRRIGHAARSSSANKVAAGTTANNYQNSYVSYTATTGTARGIYMRLYLDSGAGGEAGRFYTTVSSDTPADTVNGMHNSLSFGTTVGNVTGEGNATRNTLAVPNRTLGGTCSAVNAELWADGASSAASNASFLRCNFGGEATGLAAIEDTAALICLDGGTINTGNLMAAKASAAVTHVIRIKVNGTPYYLMVSNQI